MKVTLAALILAGLSSPALACDCVRLDSKAPGFTEDIDRIAQYYPVAAQGVLERDSPYAWRFRPTREYRGPGKPSYSITLISDCSLAPDELNAVLGKPIFVLLVEGPGDHRGHYEISRCVNLLGTEIEKALRDRIIAGCKRPR